MSYLEIPQKIFDAILEHARSAAPVEACGILSGHGALVCSIHEMTNADNSPEHFALAPAEQFAVAKRIRAAGEEMLAIYHSHPASPARPSEEDIRLAFTPGVVHVIVSLADPGCAVFEGFLVDGLNVTSVSVTGALAAEDTQIRKAHI